MFLVPPERKPEQPLPPQEPLQPRLVLRLEPEPQVLRERLKEPERHPHSERLCVVLVRP